ncbi:MAG: DUF935 family protein [Kovacikia sp.]
MLDIKTKIEIARTDPYFVYQFQGGPVPEDEHLFQRLGRDYGEYQKMRRDSHIRSVLQKRRQAILGRNVLVEAASKKYADRKAAETVEAILQKLRYEFLCSSLLGTGQLIGYSVVRVDYNSDGTLILPTTQFVPQNRFIFAYPEPDDDTVPTATGEVLDPKTEIILVSGYELRLITKQNPIKGERCPKGRFIVYTFDSEQSPWGLGLGYSIYPWWTLKREAMKAWLLQSDRLGSPPVIGTHPPELDEENDPEAADILAAFERFLKSISPNGWAKLPTGFEAKLLSDAIAAAGPDTQERLVNMADAQISKVVLGEVSYSDKSSGSYAASAAQVEDRDANLTDADCNLLDEQLAECLWLPLIELNYPGSTPPTVRRETISDQRKLEREQQEEAAKTARANRDNILINQLQLEPTDEYIKETYGVEWSLKKQEPAQPPIQIAPPPGNPENPVQMGETANFGAIVNQVLPWNGLHIGVQYAPGQVRFPNRKFAQQLRSGYGHLRGYQGNSGKALRCYIYHGLLHPDNPQGSDLMWAVDQIDPASGELDDMKVMAGYWSQRDAMIAYLREMPPEFYGGIREIMPAHLERFRRDTGYPEFSNPNHDPNTGRFASGGGKGKRLLSRATGLGGHVAENVAAWKTGKVLGGVVAAAAAAHGVNHEAAKLLSESAIQATAATLLHFRGEHGKNATAREIAAHFIAESAGALMGKVSHGEAEGVAAALGGDEHVKAISGLIAGKTAGIGSNFAAIKSGVADRVAGKLTTHGTTLKSLIQKVSGDSSDHSDSGGVVRLAEFKLEPEETAAIYHLSRAGYMIAACHDAAPKDHAEPIVLTDEDDRPLP